MMVAVVVAAVTVMPVMLKIVLEMVTVVPKAGLVMVLKTAPTRHLAVI